MSLKAAGREPTGTGVEFKGALQYGSRRDDCVLGGA